MAVQKNSDQNHQQQVTKARLVQFQRYSDRTITLNAQMSNKELELHCSLGGETTTLARLAITDLKISARSHTPIFKVACSIADLENAKKYRLRTFS